VEWNETDLDHLDPRILPPEVYGLPCLDDDKACKYFREKGECMSNPNYMYAACRISCGVCEGEDDPAWPKKYVRLYLYLLFNLYILLIYII